MMDSFLPAVEAAYLTRAFGGKSPVRISFSLPSGEVPGGRTALSLFRTVDRMEVL